MPARALRNARYPVTVDPTVGPEQTTGVAAPGNRQSEPAIAFGGTGYLVTWMDNRASTVTDVYGARVGSDGMVLDPNGIPISTDTNSQNSPAVAFDGTNYLVTWTDNRNGTAYDVYAARVSQTGTVLDPSGIPISVAAADQFVSSVAFDGTNYFVTWSDFRSGTKPDIYAARVTSGGTVLDPTGIPISHLMTSEDGPVVAFDGTNFFVAWRDFRSGAVPDLYGARVNTGGRVLDTSGIPISTNAANQDAPAVAFDGSNYLITWNDHRSGTSDVYGARVSPAGTVLDPTGIPISAAPFDQYSSSVAFDGTNYLVAWNDFRSGTDLQVLANEGDPRWDGARRDRDPDLQRQFPSKRPGRRIRRHQPLRRLGGRPVRHIRRIRRTGGPFRIVARSRSARNPHLNRG